jgi:hypothetical protein
MQCRSQRDAGDNMKSIRAKRNGKACCTEIAPADEAFPQLGRLDRFLALSDYQKEAVFRKFDRPIPMSKTRPLSAAERQQCEHAKQKVGRPRIGSGTQTISVTIEKDLLAWADAYAREKGLTRARLIGIALQSFQDDVRRYRLISNAYDKKNAARNGNHKNTTLRGSSAANGKAIGRKVRAG